MDVEVHFLSRFRQSVPVFDKLSQFNDILRMLMMECKNSRYNVIAELGFCIIPSTRLESTLQGRNGSKVMNSDILSKGHDLAGSPSACFCYRYHIRGVC